ncbi:MAG: hypothetical protein ACREV4_12590 [Gammaproteobacteria bacterium]
MKRATSLFIIVLVAVGAWLFLGGPLIDRRPNAELCNAAYALVKRQVPDDAVRREGHCLVMGSGALHTIRWAYSTATSRERRRRRSLTKQRWPLTARPITCAR